MSEQPYTPSHAEIRAWENKVKIEKYRQLNGLSRKGKIVLTGSSLMEHFPIHELLMNDSSDKIIYSRGFSGFVTAQLLEVLDDCVLKLEPSKLFINIGSNDLDRIDCTMEGMLSNYREILNRIKITLPACQIFVIAYYPVCRENKGLHPPLGMKHRERQDVIHANEAVEVLARDMGCQFINVNGVLTDSDGYLRDELACDHIHMWPEAYRLIYNQLKVFF